MNTIKIVIDKSGIFKKVDRKMEAFDFFMKGDFDVMKLFVVVPAVIQIMCLGMMFAVMFLNSQLF